MSHSSEKDQYVKSLQEELAREKARSQALVEEFKVELATNEDFSPEDLKKRFRQLLGAAWEKAIYLLDNAESEATQWQVAKYVFSVGLGSIKITDDNDPDKALNDLLEDLIKKKEVT
jgi:hypothetical protein